MEDRKEKNNRIVLFSNIKGGVGKSTLCAMFATYCREKNIDVAVIDADIQKSLARQRDRELRTNVSATVPWQLKPLGARTQAEAEDTVAKLKKIPGWILVDCPGNLNDNTLLPVFRAADTVVIPISYEDMVIDATGIFVNVFKQTSQAPVVFLPNRINETEGTRQEKEQRNSTLNLLGEIGRVTPRVKQSVVIKRFSTLYALDQYQTRAVEHAFDVIIDEIKKA